MSHDKKINLQEIITFNELKNGLKKLKRKNRYKDYDTSDFVKRYLKSKDKKENRLKKFLDKYLDDEQKIKEVPLLNFYRKIEVYSLSPYSALAIEKGKENPKKFRPLLVPEPEDRLIFDSLLPVYFTKLKDHLIQRNLLGLGLERKQRISDILHKIFNNYVNKGFCFVLTLDYSSFFSLIDRKILLEKLKNDLKDNKLLSILNVIINNEIINGREVQEKTGVKILENGIPQGLSFSPLLACYYALDIDDVYINDNNVVGFRYIDDIIIFGKNKKDLESVYQKIKEKSEELKMRLHPLGGKTQLKDLRDDYVKYLGVEISSNGLKISKEKFNEFLNIVKNEIFHIKHIEKTESKKIKEVYYCFVKGWLNHYEKIAEDKNVLYKKIDEMLFSEFFSKKRNIKSFYKANTWIRIVGNREIRK